MDASGGATHRRTTWGETWSRRAASPWVIPAPSISERRYSGVTGSGVDMHAPGADAILAGSPVFRDGSALLIQPSIRVIIGHSDEVFMIGNISMDNAVGFDADDDGLAWGDVLDAHDGSRAARLDQQAGLPRLMATH